MNQFGLGFREILVDKTLAAAAARGLRRTEAAITRAVAAIGETHGGTWRAEEKAACTAAWLALRH